MKAGAERWRVNRELVHEGMRRKKWQTEEEIARNGGRSKRAWRETLREGIDSTRKSMRRRRCPRRQKGRKREVEVSRMWSFPCGLFAC